MSGLNHKFYLVSYDKHPPSDYLRYMDAPGAVILHDDLLHYMHDTLHWIQTLNPNRNEECQGLCYYGITAIENAGAAVAQQVFSAWANLLSAGPPDIDLTGAWEFEEGAQADQGRYARVRLSRYEIVASLRELTDFAEQVLRSDGCLFILHFGI